MQRKKDGCNVRILGMKVQRLIAAERYRISIEWYSQIL
jgi:hypothetical protein